MPSSSSGDDGGGGGGADDVDDLDALDDDLLPPRRRRRRRRRVPSVPFVTPVTPQDDASSLSASSPPPAAAEIDQPRLFTGLSVAGFSSIVANMRKDSALYGVTRAADTTASAGVASCAAAIDSADRYLQHGLNPQRDPRQHPLAVALRAAEGDDDGAVGAVGGMVC